MPEYQIYSFRPADCDSLWMLPSNKILLCFGTEGAPHAQPLALLIFANSVCYSGSRTFPELHSPFWPPTGRTETPISIYDESLSPRYSFVASSESGCLAIQNLQTRCNPPTHKFGLSQSKSCIARLHAMRRNLAYATTTVFGTVTILWYTSNDPPSRMISWYRAVHFFRSVYSLSLVVSFVIMIKNEKVKSSRNNKSMVYLQ